jgi:hypothetical protein
MCHHAQKHTARQANTVLPPIYGVDAIEGLSLHTHYSLVGSLASFAFAFPPLAYGLSQLALIERFQVRLRAPYIWPIDLWA